MTIKCDVLVVGGGPAGSSAARAAAKKGAKTVLIEKQKEIKDVPCAEGIGSYLFPLLPFKIPKNQLKWKIKGIAFSDGETEIIQQGHFYKAWSIERREFDDWLLTEAKRAGTKIFMNTEFIDLKLSKNYQVDTITAKQEKKNIKIKAKKIIAADGVESDIAKKLDILKKKSDSIGYVHSWEMKNVDIKYPYLEQMYLGDFAPGAYAYVFPKSKNVANIGVGSTKEDKNLEKNFNRFIEEIIPKQVKNAEKTIDRSGIAPIKTIVDEMQYGNVYFTGDAANQNLKPYVEGILPAIICGDIAGKTASSEKHNYEQSIKKKLGKQFRESDKLLEELLKIKNYPKDKKHLISVYMFAFMDIKNIGNLATKDVSQIKNELFRKSCQVNGFITMLKYFIWYAKILTTRRD